MSWTATTATPEPVTGNVQQATTTDLPGKGESSCSQRHTEQTSEEVSHQGRPMAAERRICHRSSPLGKYDPRTHGGC